jgi:hypothetical protein
LTPPPGWWSPEEEELRRDVEECGDVIQQVGALWQIDIVLRPLSLFNDERLLTLLLFLDGGGLLPVFGLGVS